MIPHRASILVVSLLALAAALPAAAQKKPPSQVKDHTLQTWSKQQLDDRFLSEGATLGDINGDGKPDVISGPYWYEGPDFKTRHAYYPPTPFDIKVYSDNFFAFTHDFNGDGLLDILIIGFPGKDASWFQNPGPRKWDQVWERHVVADVVDNESPAFADLTGDGKPEIVCNSEGRFGYFAPDWKAPAQKWTFHPISQPKSAGGRFTHGMGVGDINGDGRADFMEKGGWWEQPVSLVGDPAWMFHPFKFSGGGAQMYAYDFNGDGMADVITSEAAHGWGLIWWEQARDADGQITFKRHQIMTSDPNFTSWGVAFSELHAMELVDIDGDGVKDIVTGKRWWSHSERSPGALDPAVVYWFRTTRNKGAVEFVPYPIDNDSGVGTQVVTGDLNGDGLLDVIVGNKKGTFVHTHGIQMVTATEYGYAHWPGMATVGYSPKAAAARMSVPEGFKSRLIAGEPDVHQPIAFTIDTRGRLWVAENYAYPTWAPEGHDRILILEDKDGDGEFETKKVFYDKLGFVSGLEVGMGGVWVGAPPNLLFIPDANGDDVPDSEPVKLLDGFVWDDAHETVNGFNWGPDGWLYGTHGVFNPSHIGKPGTPDDQRQLVNAAIWRYHPTKHVFEVFGEGTSNPWGVDFNERGQAFISACVIPHAWHIIEGGRYHRQAGPHANPYTFDDIQTIGDHVHYAGKGIRDQSLTNDEAGGGHAHAGVMMYLGDNFPDEYRDTMFMDNIRGSRINRDIPERQGSGFVAHHGKDFMLANDRWFRGLNMRYGPDGGVYLIDWYDKKVCHQQRPDDRTNGRVYKISYGDPTPVAPSAANLDAMSDSELVKLQLHKNDWFVRGARRVLQQRAATGKLAPTTRAELAQSLSIATDPTRKLRVMWALHAVGGFSADLARKTIADADEYVRAWTIQLLCEGEAPAAFLSTFAAMSVSDKSPVVRLYLASALQRLPLKDRWEIATGLVGHAEDIADHNLPLMIWYGVEPLVMADPMQAMDLALASKVPVVSRFIARRAGLDDKTLAYLMKPMKSAEGPMLASLADGLTDALKERPRAAMPAGWEAVYSALSKTNRQQAEFLAVKFGDTHVFPELRKRLTDKSVDLADRKHALQILVDAKDAEAVPVLQKLVTEPGLKSEAMRGLAAFNDPHTPEVLLTAYPSLTSSQKAEAVATLTSRPAYAAALVTAMESGKVPPRDLSAFQVRQIQKIGDKKLDERLTKAWGAIRETSADKAVVLEKYRTLLTPPYMANADASNGRAVFGRTCIACHTLFGAGGNIGPDLTGSNRTDVNYLLENIVDPSAIIGKDYQLTTIQTKDGRFLAGIIEKVSDDAVILKTLTEKAVVGKADIEKMDTLNVSMMPEGQLQTLKDTEVRDLFAYLASPGQVPLPGERKPPVTAKPAKKAAGAGKKPAASTGAPFVVPGVIEGETLKATATAGAFKTQAMTAFTAGKWSGGQHLWWPNGKPGATGTITFPVAAGGRYEVRAVLTKAHDYGIVKLKLDGETAAGPIDLYDTQVIQTEPISLGTHDLKAGDHQLTVEIVGANAKADKRYMFALDYLKLEPVK